MNLEEHITKFLSSQLMEDSEIQTRIINLGKQLAEELQLDPGVDTFSRWMAHYIAEQISIAETATGEEKIIAEKQCFETILQLWEHRSNLPNGHRPLQNYEPIFNALERLDPDNQKPYFYSNNEKNSTDDANDSINSVQHWVDIALGIDRGARTLIEFAFHQAALSGIDEKTAAWLNDAVVIPSSEDISFVVKLTTTYEDKNDEVSDKKENNGLRILQSRIELLDTFILSANEIRELLLNEANINNDNAKTEK